MAELNGRRGASSARRWTPEDENELRRLAPTMPVKALAETMNRTVDAIRHKAAHLRIPLDFGGMKTGGRRPMPWDRS